MSQSIPPSAIPLDKSMHDHLAHLTPEQRDRMLAQLLSASSGDPNDPGNNKIEDANLLLSLRPKVLITEINPRTRRIYTRVQDRKQWDNGLFNPLAHEDDPNWPQTIKVEVVGADPPEIIYEAEAVVGPPTEGEAIRIGAGQDTSLMQMLVQMQQTMADQAALIARLQGKLDTQQVDEAVPDKASKPKEKASV